MSTTARMFTLAINHDKDNNEITLDKVNQILSDYKGVHEIYAIYHDKDTTNLPHWHFLILCQNPRNFSTISKIFNVEQNFVEKVVNKRKMLRYLIHLDNPEKEQYSPDDVLSNTDTPYNKIVFSMDISNKQLFEEISINGTSAIYQYIDVIEPYRLATIQRLVGTEFQKRQQISIDRLSSQVGALQTEIRVLQDNTYQTLQLLIDTKNDLLQSFKYLAESGVPQVVTAINTALGNITKSINNLSKLPPKRY